MSIIVASVNTGYMIVTIALETTSVQPRMISKALKSVPYVLEVLNSEDRVKCNLKTYLLQFSKAVKTTPIIML